MAREKLIVMFNKALELEHAARIQYLAHVEELKGLGCEPIIARLKEIAGDEQKHEGMWRECITMLDGSCSMKLAPTYGAKETTKILEINLKAEKEAVDFYTQIYEELKKSKAELKYQYEFLEHSVRHVLIAEQEHIFEIDTLLDKKAP
ncbi:Ferritin-like domain protein [Candidatus Burarchaeum australiense]|nr:Ferritin-like domain protein [Candidatus Burarchaeum australiense]